MNYVEVMSQGFQSELQKIASEKRAKDLSSAAAAASKLKPYKIPAAIIGGVVGWEALKKINKDRKIGRQLRQQSRGRY